MIETIFTWLLIGAGLVVLALCACAAPAKLDPPGRRDLLLPTGLGILWFISGVALLQDWL